MATKNLLDIGIYSITTPSGGEYIGSSIHIKRRWHEHKWALRHNRHSNTILQRAFNKYGEEQFKFKILVICKQKDLLFYEQLLIDNLNPVYNINRKVSSSPMLGRKASPETKAKMSATRKGRKMSFETREKCRLIWLGKHLSDEHKAKISASLKSRHLQPANGSYGY